MIEYFQILILRTMIGILLGFVGLIAFAIIVSGSPNIGLFAAFLIVAAVISNVVGFAGDSAARRRARR